MEQRSLKVLDTNKTFFSKITSTITKILIPTKVGVNGMMISIKRNNLIKAYNNYNIAVKENSEAKKEALSKKYEEAFALYLEAIDKYILDSVYKKVKNETASGFEKEALSKYYMIVSLKDKQYSEYKYKKQEYLLNIDYKTIEATGKESTLEKYNPFYVEKMDVLYKGLLKNYSIQLADNINAGRDNIDEIYTKIFKTLEDYVSDILPIKISIDKKQTYKSIAEDIDKYEIVTLGKLADRDIIKKKMILLGISRSIFTHSLPLVAAEQSYIQLIKETRKLILNQKNKTQKNMAFDLLIELIEEYNIKLLSTKVYWDKPIEKEEYKKFWKKYNEIEALTSADKAKQKQILFLKNDLIKLNKKSNKYIQEIKAIKSKLVELGAMKNIKNTYISVNLYKSTGMKISKKIEA